MTTTLIAPAPLDSPAAGPITDAAGRLRRPAPVALPMILLPTADVVGLATAGLRLGLLSAAALVTLRAAACAALRSAHRRGWLLEPALVVGAGATAVRVVELLGNHPELGVAPRGFLDSRLAEQCTPLPLLGEPAELAGEAL